jgi:pimeloyl-ACP methyl ester carboxylesterase
MPTLSPQELSRVISRSEELRALSRMAFEEVGNAPAGIGQVHRAIAGRAFGGVRRGVGRAAWPAQAVHDAVARRVYAGLRGAAGLAGTSVDVVLRQASDVGPPLSTTRPGSLLIGVLQGLRGDALEREEPALAQPMAVRVAGQPVPPEPAGLAAAFPQATPRIVVFLHGLMETEHSWSFGGGPTYGDRLAEDLGCTPVYVRYNSGRHVSENGRSLADLLGAVVEGWPVPADEIALVGHSMGGLVARSACFQASEDRVPWVRRVRHVVSVGTPHMGAPLEQAVHYASAALNGVPETRPLGDFLRRRSAGIRDLRQGSLVDEDWRDRDPDALRASACNEVPLLDGATHCFVTATLTRSDRHPLGRLLGDCLVLTPSASGRGRNRRIAFRPQDGVHVGGAHHFALLNHPAVYAKLREWLT